MIKPHSGKGIPPMGLSYVTVSLRAAGQKRSYRANFLVDTTGATDTLAPASELRKAGIAPIGKTAYELADGSLPEYDFGLAGISFMGK